MERHGLAEDVLAFVETVCAEIDKAHAGERAEMARLQFERLVEVGKRYRDRDGCLCVAWSVPPSRIEDEIIFLHS